jgi:hypothetical protein
MGHPNFDGAFKLHLLQFATSLVGRDGKKISKLVWN